MFPPHFAGSILNVQYGPTDDGCWEQEIMDYMEDLAPHGDNIEDEDEILDEGKPLVVNDEELEKLDVEARFTEIQRLLKWES